MVQVRALIIVGYGLNCEAETDHAIKTAGAEVEQVHLNDLIAGKRRIEDFQLLALIGGFSFGDHISAGKVFANRLKCRLAEALGDFVDRGNLVIGICNGFQTLVKLGLLPGFDGDHGSQSVTLAANDSGVFRNAWVRLQADPDTRCVFTRGMDGIDLPVRHGEGKFVARDPEVLQRLKKDGQVVLRYADPASGEPTMDFPSNPNGSMDAIAGICDPSGRIFGLMPHPEAYVSPYNHPHWMRQQLAGTLPETGSGLAFFRNAVAFLKKEGGSGG